MMGHKKRTGGFTLLEMVFASAILVAGLAILLTAFSFAGKAVYNSRNQVQALNFAREQLELRRRYVFRDSNLNVGTYAITSSLYKATVVISSIDTKQKNLTVNVAWTNYALRASVTTSYSTIIADAIH